MQPVTPASSDEALPPPDDFSLVIGGPFFQLLRRAHLSGDALSLVRQRVLVISLVAWLPLLVLSVVEGQALGGSVGLPFLLDPEAHARFLLAMPLLVFAELLVHQRMLPMARQFQERHLVSERTLPRFQAVLASAARFRSSLLAEVVLLVLVYGVGILVVWRQYVALDAASWYVRVSAEGPGLSLAGRWYGFVSLPIFQFLLFRWYFRLFIWARFLWLVSRIELDLMPSHPGRSLPSWRRRDGQGCASMECWRSGTSATSTPSGCAAVRPQGSRWWGAPTSATPMDLPRPSGPRSNSWLPSETAS